MNKINFKMLSKILFLRFIFVFLISSDTILIAGNIFDLLDTDNSNVESYEKNLLNKKLNTSADFISKNSVEIIILNKITAKSEKVVLKLNQPIYVGNLYISLDNCFSGLTENGEKNDIAFLTIEEEKIDEDSITLFRNWLFSSNIALNNFDHPAYQVILSHCI